MEIILFDTETTGLNTYHDDIVEVAGVIWQKGVEPKQFQELISVNPNKMTPGAQKVHKISPQDLATARQPSEVLSDFVNFCDGRSLVAHNIRFDFDMLNSNLIRNQLRPYPNDQVACSLAYSKSQGTPGKLSELATHYKVKVEQSGLHRAMYDVYLLKEVMNRFMKENEPAEMQYSLIL